MNYFWVNISETYQEVANNNYLWAPLPYTNEEGIKQNNAGWPPLGDAKLGDIFFCKNGASFDHVAVVTREAYEDKRPATRAFDRWKDRGRRVDVSLIKIDSPIQAESIKDEFLNNFYDLCIPKVITVNKTFCEIYASSIPKEAGKYLLNLLGNAESELNEIREVILNNNYLTYELPYKSHSWTILNETVIYKVIDKTIKKEKSSGIPTDIVSFLYPTPLKNSQKIELEIIVNNKNFTVILEKKADGRHRLNLSNISVQLKLSKLLEDTDKIWFERDVSKLNSFYAYTSSRNKKYAVRPKQKKPNGGTTRIGSREERVGHEYFKQEVSIVCDNRCIVTGVVDQIPSILIGSHIKSWKDSNDDERIDGENGLLLAPHVDKLFDIHLITFSEFGKILPSKKLAKSVLKDWGINIEKNYSLTPNQQTYMIYHREKFNEKQSKK